MSPSSKATVCVCVCVCVCACERPAGVLSNALTYRRITDGFERGQTRGDGGED